MTEARCENCRFMHAAVIGIVECSFAPDGFMDRIRRECRRFPPVPSFWGDRFPAGRREVMGWLREIWFDWRLAVFLRRKTTKRTGKQLIQRKSDGSLWIAGCPQNIGYAMRGLFNKNPGWHFYRARKWRGLFIASRRVFWLPNSGEFTWPQNVTAFLLPPWPENVECRLIDSRLPTPGDG